MVNKKGIYLAISFLAVALWGYVDLDRKYSQLDKKFTATADSLQQYKATVQNQGLYGPLRKDLDKTKREITQLRGYVGGFFEGSEKNFNELAEENANTRDRVSKLEAKANNLVK